MTYDPMKAANEALIRATSELSLALLHMSGQAQPPEQQVHVFNVHGMLDPTAVSAAIQKHIKTSPHSI